MSMLVEYRERMTKALVELKELQGKDERSADDESRVDALLAEVNDLGPKIEREAAVEAATRHASQYTESRSGRQVATEGAQESKGESRQANGGSFGRRFAQSDQLKDYANRPVNSSQRYDAGSFFHRGNPEDMEQRALVYTGATASLVGLDRVPGIFRGDLMPFTVSMRDVIPNYTTDSNRDENVPSPIGCQSRGRCFRTRANLSPTSTTGSLKACGSVRMRPLSPVPAHFRPCVD
jgi:hypothetical protein